MKPATLAATSPTDIERERIIAEFERREREIDPARYAPWNPVELLYVFERKRVAAELLHSAGVFPARDSRCLEVGVGRLGWLPDLIGWGVAETGLHGIDLSETRIAESRLVLPAADLRVGNAAALPWQDGEFDYVIASLLITSVLDPAMRQSIASEIVRVLAPRGALIWYDFAMNNPGNPNVRRVTRAELVDLFRPLRGKIRRLTLAPPVVRIVAPVSWAVANVLSSVPFLKTHLLAILLKP